MRSAITIALLALFGGSYVGLAAVEATAIHATCPEHGELIHASSGHGPSTNAYAPDPAEEDTEHEHCLARLAPGERAASVAVCMDATTAIAWSVAPLATPRAASVLDRAPKTSPPA